MDDFLLISADDLMNEPDPHVDYDAKARTFDLHPADMEYVPGRPYYSVELSRCNTPMKLIAWMHHLSEKDWFTCPMQQRFIEEWARVTKNPVPFNV